MLLDIVDKPEEPSPSYTVDAPTVRVGTPPDEDGLAYDMVFGDESPVARVERVVTVVTLHPVVVHLEGVLRRLLAVDEYLAVLDFQGVAFIGADGPLVDGQVLQCQVDALALLGNPDGSVVVTGSVQIAVQRVDVEVVGIGIE